MRKLPEIPPFKWRDYLEQEKEKIAGDPEILKEAEEFNRRYLFWDELKYRIQDINRRKSVWTMMKLSRTVRFEKVPFDHLRLVYSLIPDINKGLHTIDRYLSGTLRIHNKAITLEKSYIVNSLMEEAIASSVLEGAVTTRKAAKEMLRKGKKPQNDSERMILNNYEAMQYIREKKEVPLSKELILEIHRIVTKGTIKDEYVGQFRSDNDIVVADSATGLIHHTPPKAEDIEKFIDEICGFANGDGDDAESITSAQTFIHPVIKGIILHFLIGYLHPFNDGNGRTARSIFYWYVLSRGYWLFEYMPISRIILRSRAKYSLAYLHTEFDNMDTTYFIKYNINCIFESLKDLLVFLEKQQTIQNATKAIIREIKEINTRQAGVLRDMMEHSDEYFTIHQVAQVTDTVYQTARTDLLRLRDLGYISQEKRGREYLFIFNEKSKFWDEKNLQKKITPT
ncbi:MAG: Fic family protein [Methanospirillum sp.]